LFSNGIHSLLRWPDSWALASFTACDAYRNFCGSIILYRVAQKT